MSRRPILSPAPAHWVPSLDPGGMMDLIYPFIFLGLSLKTTASPQLCWQLSVPMGPHSDYGDAGCASMFSASFPSGSRPTHKD